MSFVCERCGGRVCMVVEGSGILAECEGGCGNRIYYPWSAPGAQTPQDPQFWFRDEDEEDPAPTS